MNFILSVILFYHKWASKNCCYLLLIDKQKFEFRRQGLNHMPLNTQHKSRVIILFLPIHQDLFKKRCFPVSSIFLCFFTSIIFLTINLQLVHSRLAKITISWPSTKLVCIKEEIITKEWGHRLFFHW